MKGLWYIMVVAAGIMLGFFGAVKTGLTDRIGVTMGSSGSVPNKTAIAIGDHFPDLIVSDEAGTKRPVSSIIGNRPAIIGIVSATCLPCLEFVAAVNDMELVRSGAVQVVYLATDSDAFLKNTGMPSYEPEQSDLAELEIQVFPTIVIVDSLGEVRSVSTGFGRLIDEPFIRKHLR